MKVKVHLDSKEYMKKPQGNVVGQIVNRIITKITYIDVGNLAEVVGNNGVAFVPAIMNGAKKKENFVQQQVFVLDIDYGLTVFEFFKRAREYRVMPAFVYASYNYKSDSERYRAVFINDCEICDARVAEIMDQMLYIIFPEADQMCKSDISRMYFGGRKLLYVDPDAQINLVDVARSVEACLFDYNQKHYRENIRKIACDIGVNCIDGMLDIKKCDSQGDFWGTTNKDITIMVNLQNSPFFYCITQTFNVDNNAQRRREKINKKYLYEGKSVKSKLLSTCLLYHDFANGEELSHQEKLLLATNLLHIKGGKNLFFENLTENISKWKMDWKYMNNSFYHPQSCKKGECKYYNQCRCQNILAKLKNDIKRIETEIEYVSLDEAQSILENRMEKLLLTPGTNQINLLKAQTALGKTHAYCKIIRKYQKRFRFMVVVPTNKLQYEVYNQLKSSGVDVVSTPNVKEILSRLGMTELLSSVENLYDTGLGILVKPLIAETMKSNEDPVIKTALRDYLNFKETMVMKKVVVTTHAMFLHLPEEIISEYKIIVDEDILATIFKNTNSISFYDLRKVIEEGFLPFEFNDRLKQLMSMPDRTVVFTGMATLFESQLKNIYERNENVSSGILNFIQSTTCYVDVLNEQIHYFTGQRIPNVKMLIVSATMNVDLYRNYVSGRTITYHEVPLVQLRGKLIQYTKETMSRAMIDTYGYEKMYTQLLKHIGKENGINTITFKKYTSFETQIYIGKSEGFNDYKGEDLLVIGTPHNVPFVYALIGKTLGFDANDTLAVRRVKHNGYEFCIMTYGDEGMRKLQFYFIESELEQAIGRARALRYPCTIFLFSNYPLLQAQIIQEPFLE